MNIYMLFQKGGVFMYPLLICSTIVLAIVLERCYYFSKVKDCSDKTLEEVEQLVYQHRTLEAKEVCEDTNCPVSQVLSTGIKNYQKPREERDRILQRIGSKELQKMGKNIRGLGIIAHVSPLIGLLGTVTGMIKAFMKIYELGGSVDPSVLAGGISEALITTAAGLTVAIPAMLFYQYFEGKLDGYYNNMKEAVQLLSEWLGEKQSELGETKEDMEYGF
ncbi:MotA/TolQ/ExbB proton channel family protein [Orenia marismortui]|uniref:MotA/TolQ/ExbB proton channel family protein n=1 Tax=Orenia marismortui TaxID=46469 RepID=UPI00036269D7|nr:MotA/TolQ/ExbB proton channel family protein [Orenia marismortui]